MVADLTGDRAWVRRGLQLFLRTGSVNRVIKSVGDCANADVHGRGEQAWQGWQFLHGAGVVTGVCKAAPGADLPCPRHANDAFKAARW